MPGEEERRIVLRIVQREVAKWSPKPVSAAASLKVLCMGLVSEKSPLLNPSGLYYACWDASMGGAVRC